MDEMDDKENEEMQKKIKKRNAKVPPDHPTTDVRVKLDFHVLLYDCSVCFL